VLGRCVHPRDSHHMCGADQRRRRYQEDLFSRDPTKTPNLEATSVSPALTVFGFPRIFVEGGAYGCDGAD